MFDIQVLAIIWSCVVLASLFADNTRLTPVLWYLFFGSLFVNLGVLPSEMPVFIVDLAELGIIVIMFAIGFEEEPSNFLGSVKRSWGIAFFGAIAPFSIAYALSYIFWKDTNMALLCGLAMTATAVSLTMVSLKSEGLNNSPAATGIMTSAVIDDIASLALVAALVPIATGDAVLSITGLILIVGKVIAFFLAVIFIGAALFPVSKGFMKKVPLIGHFSLNKILTVKNSEYTILALLLIAVLVGLLAHHFGFHPAVGAYMAGLIIRQKYFSINQDGDDGKIGYEHARKMIDNVAFTWLGPVFFVVLGTNLIYDGALFLEVLPHALLIFVCLFAGQILSAATSAKFMGKYSWPESWMIGFGMLGRAELAFVVMEIAYVQYQIISTEVFYTLMITCFLLNVSVPLMIRWWKFKFDKTESPTTK